MKDIVPFIDQGVKTVLKELISSFKEADISSNINCVILFGKTAMKIKIDYEFDEINLLIVLQQMTGSERERIQKEIFAIYLMLEEAYGLKGGMLIRSSTKRAIISDNHLENLHKPYVRKQYDLLPEYLYNLRRTGIVIFGNDMRKKIYSPTVEEVQLSINNRKIPFDKEFLEIMIEKDDVVLFFANELSESFLGEKTESILSKAFELHLNDFEEMLDTVVKDFLKKSSELILCVQSMHPYSFINHIKRIITYKCKHHNLPCKIISKQDLNEAIIRKYERRRGLLIIHEIDTPQGLKNIINFLIEKNIGVVLIGSYGFNELKNELSQYNIERYSLQSKKFKLTVDERKKIVSELFSHLKFSSIIDPRFLDQVAEKIEDGWTITAIILGALLHHHWQRVKRIPQPMSFQEILKFWLSISSTNQFYIWLASLKKL